MNKSLLVVTILAAALVSCRTINEPAQKAQTAQPKPKIQEIVIDRIDLNNHLTDDVLPADLL